MKRKLSLIFFAALLLPLVTACGKGFGTSDRTDKPDKDAVSPTNTSATVEDTIPVYHKLTASDAHDMMAESEGYIILDVRSKSEYEESRIEDSMLIPADELARRAEAELPDKGQLIFVYCRSGARSERASRALVELGYTNIYDFGGIISWPYDTVSG